MEKAKTGKAKKAVKPKPEKKDAKPAKAEKKAPAKHIEVARGWGVLSLPHTTEKSIGLIEKENTLVFMVDRRANKIQIEKAVEDAFDVKVESVRTVITIRNFKKAFVKLSKDNSASEVAIRMGII